MKSELYETIDREFLPLVIRPGRYVGNELNSIHKEHSNRVRVALCFPDLYEIGMSHLGLQILYHRFNSLDAAVAERVFAPDVDAERRLREIGTPLFSLESRTPLTEFDMIGFTVAYELCSTNILNVLDLAGIPLRAMERTDVHPIVMLGGPCTFNPEPLADFADAIFLGDAEEAVPEIVEALQERSELTRTELLVALSKIEGMYIPSYYEPQYDEKRFTGIKRIEATAPEVVKARKLDELKSEFYTDRPIVPFVEITHDRLPIEIMRGCGRACRFCQAGIIYRPKRQRKPEDVIRHARKAIEATGFSELTLLSLSSSDYTDIEKLVSTLSTRLQNYHVDISLPSLRPNGLSPELARKLSSVRRAGLTLAPEAGTERLREVINKPVPEEEFFDAIRAAFDNDWQTLKLYFMIGLPTETDEDLDGICALLKKIARLVQQTPGKRTINVTTSPFCPKAHTPWQWEKQISCDEILQRQKYISKNSPRSINVRYRSPGVTLLESALGRGDRRVGDAIEHAFRNGARLDGWSEHLQYDKWVESFDAVGLDISDYHSELSYDAPLPWDHVTKGVSRDFLMREALRSKGLVKDDKAGDSGDSAGGDSSGKRRYDTSAAFGRRSKRLKSQTSMQIPNSRVRIKWGKDREQRFLSHLDNTRAFERAIRRAKVPVAYSQGYHPHQKVAFGPPLTLGYSSSSEYFDLQLTTPYDSAFFKELSLNMPPGFRVIEAKPVFGRSESLSALINLACYEVILPLDESVIRESVDKVMTSESIPATRKTKTDLVEVDIRPGIIDLEIVNVNNSCCVIHATTGLGNMSFTRPSEIFQFGFQMSGQDVLKLDIKRIGLFILRENEKLTPFQVI